MTKTVSIGRVIAGRRGVKSRPVAAALVVAVLMPTPYPGNEQRMTGRRQSGGAGGAVRTVSSCE
jgi:hypothetical protein